MKAALTVLLLLCMCVSAYGQFPQQVGPYYAAPPIQSPIVSSYPPYPPYPPQCAPHGDGRGGDYQTALIQLLAIQNLLNQQTEVQRGWHDRNNEQLATIIRQQEFARMAVGFREQFDWQSRLQQQQHPQPILLPQPRRGLFGRR